MNRLEFCLRLAKGIFAGKQLANEQWQRAKPPQEFQQFISYWKPRTFVNGTLRGIDVDLKIDGGLRKFRFIEQNPNKTDNKGALKSFAQQARDGSQIVWLIDQGNDKFLGRIQDGTWYAAEERAYSVANQNSQPVVAPNQFDESYIPEIPDTINVPEYVQNYTEMDMATLIAMSEEQEIYMEEE